MSPRSVADAPGAVLAVAVELVGRGLVEGSAGNVSARRDDGAICITPTSLPYERMELGDLVVVDLEGQVVEGPRQPSSELQLHLACYRAFPHVAAVVHTHPVHATMFAVAHQPVPVCVDEFAMHVGGDVRVAAYAPSGSAELGDRAVEALEGRAAALLANHGLVSVGPTPARALAVTTLVERTAAVAWGARALGQVYEVPGEAASALAAEHFRPR